MVASRAKINNEVKRIKELADNLDNLVIAGYSIKLNVSDLTLIRLICADLDNTEFFMFYSKITEQDFRKRVEELCKMFRVDNKYALIGELRNYDILPAGLTNFNFGLKFRATESNKKDEIILFDDEIKVLKCIKNNKIKNAEYLLTGFLKNFNIISFTMHMKKKLNLQRVKDVIPVLTYKGII